MKTRSLKLGISMIIVLVSHGVQAGVEKFNSDEFNAIISENLQAEQDLRNQLSADAGVPEMQAAESPAKGEVVGVMEEENVIVPTDLRPTVAAKDKSQKKLLEKNLKRVSQEIESLDLAD